MEIPGYLFHPLQCALKFAPRQAGLANCQRLPTIGRVYDKSCMLGRIVIAKVEWADYYQGEQLQQTFRDGDQYERYNFRRCADGPLLWCDS